MPINFEQLRIFKELKNKNYFKQVRVAFGSIEWPNEQDFSKDTLYLLGTSIPAAPKNLLKPTQSYLILSISHKTPAKQFC